MGSCANCGARLGGAYCSACGQRVEPRIQPLSYFIIEHLLFLIHNQAFAFLFFALYLLASFVVPAGARGAFGLVAFAYLSWYFFRSMRRVYAEGRARTFTKFAMLGFMYLVSGAVMVPLTAFVSAISL